MSASESDYLPSEDDEEEEQHVADPMTGVGAMTEDYLTEDTSGDEEGGGTFFEGGVDPIALVEGMETTDRVPHWLLQRRRRSRRLARKPDDTEAEMDEDDQDADGGGTLHGGGDVEMGEADGLDAEGNVEDVWNDALAEKFGMAPVLNRRKARHRERWRRRQAKKGIAPRRDIPEEASKKLGEANLLYAMQRHQEAITLLQDVIRLAPNASDPYHLLGLLYEEIGDRRKALNFFMIAAHLTPRQADLWRRLADMSSKEGLIRQAVYCLTQVCRRDKEDVDARYDRSLLLSSLGQDKKAVEGLEIVRASRPEHPEVVKQLARLYYRTSQIDKAVAVLQDYWQAYPDTTDLTHVNLLAELLSIVEVGDWKEVLDVIARAQTHMLSDGAALPMELMIKAANANLHLGKVDEAMETLQTLLTQPFEVYGDLYLAAADALESIGRHDLALPFLSALAQDPAVTGQDTWRRLAESAFRGGGPQAAVEVWRGFVDALEPTSPFFMDAIVAFAEALKDAGDEQSAVETLNRLGASLPSDDGSIAALGIGLTGTEEDLLARAGILKACGREDLLVKLSLPSLKVTLAGLANADDSQKRGQRTAGGIGGAKQPQTEDAVFLGYMSDKRRRRGRKRKTDGGVTEGEGDDGELTEADVPQQARDLDNASRDEVDVGDVFGGLLAPDGSILPPNGQNLLLSVPAPLLPGIFREEEAFQLLVDTTAGLIRTGRPQEARWMSQIAVDILGRRKNGRRWRDTMRLLLAEACLVEDDLSTALTHLKAPTARWHSSPVVWNLFSRFLIAAGGVRHTIKFLTPLRYRHPGSMPLALMHGHAYLQSGAYGVALEEYFQAYRKAPEEPLVLLCIAIALINQAASKYAEDRHLNVLHAFAFLDEYRSRRGDPVEASYNTGRAAQLLSLNFLAVPLYERALVADSTGNSVIVQENRRTAAAQAMAWNKEGDSEKFNLGREAAFNLSLILKNSGAKSMAKQLLREHLTY